jgi:hypothetical protein
LPDCNSREWNSAIWTFVLNILSKNLSMPASMKPNRRRI